MGLYGWWNSWKVVLFPRAWATEAIFLLPHGEDWNNLSLRLRCQRKPQVEFFHDFFNMTVKRRRFHVKLLYCRTTGRGERRREEVPHGVGGGGCGSERDKNVQSLYYHHRKTMKKCTPRFYFVRQLKRAHLATSELLTFYLCCIRPRRWVRLSAISQRTAQVPLGRPWTYPEASA